MSAAGELMPDGSARSGLSQSVVSDIVRERAEFRQAALELHAEIRSALLWIESGAEPSVAYHAMRKCADRWLPLLDASSEPSSSAGDALKVARFTDRYVLLDAVIDFLWANNSKVAAAKVSTAFGVSGALKGTEEEPSP